MIEGGCLRAVLADKRCSEVEVEVFDWDEWDACRECCNDGLPDWAQVDVPDWAQVDEDPILSESDEKESYTFHGLTDMRAIEDKMERDYPEILW